PPKDGGAAPKRPTPQPAKPEPTPVVAHDPPPQTPTRPTSDDAAAALMRKADEEIGAARASGDADALRRALAPKVWDRRFSAVAREAWLEESRLLAKRVVFSATPMKHAIFETVRDGDHYVGICARLKKEKGLSVVPGFLSRVNDVAPEKLRPNMKLKVPTEPLSIVVDKDDFRLWLLLGDGHLLDYKVGLGRDEKTPEGAFVISEKTKNPMWTDPRTNRDIRYGEPGHLIGSRWLRFGTLDGARTTFGIHGTVDPQSIGKAQSDGCVRMRTPDVEELYDLVPAGAKVVVRR
ncbi:MAG TPA: L,D-transpeptidase, partial [Planctomycetota bacterium]|nr:L,D-transpeptidase [Planctomycetota bacterium]